MALTPEDIAIVFEGQARHFRATEPAIYAKVDRILSRQNRVPRYSEQMFDYAGPVGECARCGDDYPTFGWQSRFCSPECRAEHKAWCAQRGQRFNRPDRSRKARRINGQVRA